jgi:translation initiation factor 1
MTRRKGKLVYSTQTGDQRKQQHQIPKRERSLPPAEQNLKIMRDKKGRRGKVVTVTAGFVLSESDLKELAKTLKNYCGAGGTAKTEETGQSIEIQGDHREKIAEKLASLGFKVKFAGG